MGNREVLPQWPGDVVLLKGKKVLTHRETRCNRCALVNGQGSKREAGSRSPPGSFPGPRQRLRAPELACAREVTRGGRAGAGGVAGCGLRDFLSPGREGAGGRGEGSSSWGRTTQGS